MKVSQSQKDKGEVKASGPVEEELMENSPMCLRSKRKIELKPRQKRAKAPTLQEPGKPTEHPFTSCLSYHDSDVMSPTSPAGSRAGTDTDTVSGVSSRTSVLKRAISVEELDETSWLSSSVIDLVFSKFAKYYRNAEYLSIDFIYLALNNYNTNTFEGMTDILGQTLQYNHSRPILLLYNSNNIHWTLIRIQYMPEPSIQLFEPMGKPQHRNGQLSYRDVPRELVRWLDTCCPLPENKSWLAVTRSAITKQHQFTSFDCGVACLLYAEKCGLGQDTEDINDLTSQEHITEYRKLLQAYINKQKQSADVQQ